MNQIISRNQNQEERKIEYDPANDVLSINGVKIAVDIIPHLLTIKDKTLMRVRSHVDSFGIEKVEDDFSGLITHMNEAVRMDKGAMHSLVMNRILVNEEFAKDSIFFCTGKHEEKNGYNHMTAIGFLNGILDELGLPRIAHKFDSDGEFLGFDLYKEPTE